MNNTAISIFCFFRWPQTHFPAHRILGRLFWGVVCIKYPTNSRKKGEFSKNNPHKWRHFFTALVQSSCAIGDNKRGSFSLVPIDVRPFPNLTCLTYISMTNKEEISQYCWLKLWLAFVLGSSFSWSLVFIFGVLSNEQPAGASRLLPNWSWLWRCCCGVNNRFSSSQETNDVRLACEEDSGTSGALLLYCGLRWFSQLSSYSPSTLTSVPVIYHLLYEQVVHYNWRHSPNKDLRLMEPEFTHQKFSLRISIREISFKGMLFGRADSSKVLVHFSWIEFKERPYLCFLWRVDFGFVKLLTECWYFRGIVKE